MSHSTGNRIPAIALIGISGYGNVILQALSEVLPRTSGRLVAATVINKQQEREACVRLQANGCAIFEDYRQMLDSLRGKIDLCIIPTSIHWHAPMVVDALKAGAHVLVEKPLAGSLEDARLIVNAERNLKRMVAVGFQDMYAPATWQIKDFLLSTTLGAIKSIEISGSWPRSELYYNRNNWAGRKFCEGRAVFDSPLNNAFAHFLNLALFFAGPVRNDSALIYNVNGRLMRFFPIETCDTAQLTMTTTGGIPLSITVTHADPVQVDPSITIHTQRGVLIWQHLHDAIAYQADGRELSRWKLPSNPAALMIHQVIGALPEKGTPLCPASLAFRHAEALAQIASQVRDDDMIKSSIFGAAARNSPWEPVPNLYSTLCNIESDANGHQLEPSCQTVPC